MGQQAQLKMLLNQQDATEMGRSMVYFDYLNNARTEQITTFLASIEKKQKLETAIASTTNIQRVLKIHIPQLLHAGTFTEKASRPAYSAAPPNSSSMRKSWLYLAIRSDRDNDPVLICVARVPTAMSAIVLSEVSPER